MIKSCICGYNDIECAKTTFGIYKNPTKQLLQINQYTHQRIGKYQCFCPSCGRMSGAYKLKRDAIEEWNNG